MQNSENITDLRPSELRHHIADHQEDEFVLIDVRQPEEYQRGHVPGAKLFPLTELELHADQLRGLANKDLIFYCRSGGRSLRAARFAATGLELPRVFNLVGGMLAWNGELLPDFPSLRAEQLGGTAAEVLHRALDMEKGAYDLYTALQTRFDDSALTAELEALARAELGHGRKVFTTMAQVGRQPTGDFAAVFARQEGALIEGGKALGQVADRVEQAGQAGLLYLLELALEIELRAYDLYKSLAQDPQAASVRDPLLDLAQQEKRHAQMVARKLGQLAQ